VSGGSARSDYTTASATIHEQVTGAAPDGRSYAASDPRLLTWVHIAEADSFLRAHSRFGTSPIDQAGSDRYVADLVSGRATPAATARWFGCRRFGAGCRVADRARHAAA
jgi:uncharacterized protein (DUF2236 family)